MKKKGKPYVSKIHSNNYFNAFLTIPLLVPNLLHPILFEKYIEKEERREAESKLIQKFLKVKKHTYPEFMDLHIAVHRYIKKYGSLPEIPNLNTFPTILKTMYQTAKKYDPSLKYDMQSVLEIQYLIQNLSGQLIALDMKDHFSFYLDDLTRIEYVVKDGKRFMQFIAWFIWILLVALIFSLCI